METYKVTLSCINEDGIDLVSQIYLLDDIDQSFIPIAKSFVDKMKSYMLVNNCCSWVTVDYFENREHDYKCKNAEAKADCMLHDITKGTPYDGWEC